MKINQLLCTCDLFILMSLSTFVLYYFSCQSDEARTALLSKSYCSSKSKLYVADAEAFEFLVWSTSIVKPDW
ncbi:hypothetical protein FOCC_FOCC000905 [Frankliniella occidentalis]|nr:hypothetical protein FOCC_FOCC000905 [Frankliniella occidentalis]